MVWHQYLCQAIAFYTRIPCYTQRPFDLSQTHRYLSLIGLLIGCWSAGIYILAQQFFPPTIAIILSLISTLLLTGGLHEDGFADSCDGLGGGWHQAQILTIMKDSRLGTYGVLGLNLLLLLKFYLLLSIPATVLAWAFVLAHSLSRFSLFIPLITLNYLPHADSKTSISKKIPVRELLISSVFLLPLFYFDNLNLLVIAFAVAFIVTIIFSHYFKQRLGGYTGDCLGAMQQLAEMGVYLTINGFYFNLSLI